MTEIETDVETVTVTLEELKANLEHYYWMLDTRRLVVTFHGEVVAVVGRWIPEEGGRGQHLRWHDLLHEMYPEPIDPEDREPGTIGLEMARGYRPSSISMLQPSPSWSETRNSPRHSGDS
jgi:hypothetical protein